MRGRKPTHPNLKLIAGTCRPDRAVSVAHGTAVEGVPEPPTWIRSERGVAEWHRLVAILHANGMLNAESLSALAVLCALHGTVADQFAAGLTPNAALIGQLRGLSADFGLTGVVQSRPQKAANPFARNGKRPAEK